MTTWMVTGGSGFLGRHVLAALAEPESGRRVVALGRHHPGGWPMEDFLRADLEDPIALERALQAIRPDVTIHAAGKTPPAPAPLLYRANTRCVANLIEALRRLGRPTRLVLAGSAAELGPVPADRLPASESFPCRPLDAYGLSKWAACRIALAAGPPVEAVSARIFNMIGPGMPTSQAFGRFARDLLAPGPDPLVLNVGDLDARRDFVDVRDAASALILLAERGDPGAIYHVGTGRSRAIGDGLDRLIGLSGRDVRVERIGAGRGPADSRAEIARIVEAVGWRPEVPFETSLADLWDEARRLVGTRRVA